MPGTNRAIRNPVAQSPLLRKGGVHTESKTGQRVRDRMKVSSAIDEWAEEIEDRLDQSENVGSNGSPFSWVVKRSKKECVIKMLIL